MLPNGFWNTKHVLKYSLEMLTHFLYTIFLIKMVTESNNIKETLFTYSEEGFLV